MSTKRLPFRNNLRSIRKQHGLSQQQLADVIGLSKSEICRYECGNRRPTQYVIKKLSIYFNISIEELLGYESELNNHGIKWSYIQGRQREVVYLCIYKNVVDDPNFFGRKIVDRLPLPGGKLKEGFYIWFSATNMELTNSKINGTRLLVQKTSDMKIGDIVVFQFCRNWFWVGEVDNTIDQLQVNFFISGLEKKIYAKSLQVLGKVVQVTLDL